MELNHRPDGYKPSALTPELLERYSLNLVPRAGLEPARISPRDFKSLVSTYSTTEALFGLPRGIRTPDQQLRRLLLYPTELWAVDGRIILYVEKYVNQFIHLSSYALTDILSCYLQEELCVQILYCCLYEHILYFLQRIYQRVQ